MPEKIQQQDTEPSLAFQLTLGGQVQGVGFRPFVYRLGRQHNLTGWVQNLRGNVLIHVEGRQQDITNFIDELFQSAPRVSKPELLLQQPTSLAHVSTFTIKESDVSSSAQVHTPVDYAPCEDCLSDIADPENRRFHYPFTNCTQCGPRYTLIERLPYDRTNTTMAGFSLCEQCLQEYNNPEDRRFHAEPIACPVCGPAITYKQDHTIVVNNQAALEATIEALATGQIVAVKGVGGYHLFCDAHNEQAIHRLRLSKPRPDKPLALMFPVQGDDEMDAVRHYVTLTPMEEQLISSTARPIVLVKKNHGCTLPDSIAPGLDELGCCLPYSPLHYLLANSFNAPLIATSANISGEPVLTDEHEITQRLAHVTATCLHHDRPIARPADDSVVRVIAGRPRTLRVGRGYAPVEMSLPIAITKPTLAVGAHMKNSIALAWDNRLVLSPHISDLGTVRSLSIFEQVIDDFQTLYDVEVEQITCDAHPGYSSSRWAHQQNLPVLPVLHHHAHASALALEFPQHKPWLVFTWDGTGYGEADQLWGGEAFYGTPGNWRRVASFKPFRLMGGDLASRQAWRSAAALCWQSGEHYEVPQNQSLVKQAWEQQINCMNSSSVGRLFDAASALTGLATEYSFEGQGPMLLEAQCDHSHPASPLLVTYENQIYSADWQPLLTTLTDDQLTIAERGIYFHETLAATLVEQAKLIRQEYGELVIGLAGGVFQNKFLTERAIHYLNHSRFDCYVNEVIPLNDGGISAGQIMETLAGQNKRT